MNDTKKELEVISGDGSDLNISPVYEHLNAGKPKCKDEKRKNIVVPKEKNKTKLDNNSESEISENKHSETK